MHLKTVVALSALLIAPNAFAAPCLDQFTGKSVSWRLECLADELAKKTSALPAGTVVAMTQKCPTKLGWSSYSDAYARVIIGAVPPEIETLVSPKLDNLDDYRYPKKLGSEKVTLEEMHMPQHTHISHPNSRHAIANSAGTNIDRIVSVDNQRAPNLSDTSKVKPFGGLKGKSQPHNNMPPYIALNFCIKD